MIKQFIFIFLLIFVLSCKVQKISIATYIPYDGYYNPHIKSSMGMKDFETLIKYPIKLQCDGNDFYWYSKSEFSISNKDTIKWILSTIRKNITSKFPVNWEKKNKLLWDFNPQDAVTRYPGYLYYDPENSIKIIRTSQGYHDTLPDFSRVLNLRYRIIYVKNKQKNNDTIYLSSNTEVGVIKNSKIKHIGSSLIIYNKQLCCIRDSFWSSSFYYYLSYYKFKPQENKYWCQ